MSIIIYRGSSKPIFLISEEHRTPNLNEGGNQACREKLKELLDRAEKSPDGGYCVFVEFKDTREGEMTVFESLTRIYFDAEKFQNSRVEDVENRRIMGAITHIFGEPLSWIDYKRYYAEECTYPKEAENVRRTIRRNFGCDLNTVTLGDLYKEVDEQIEQIKNLQNYWYWDSMYYLLKDRLRNIAYDYEKVKQVMKKYYIDESERFVQAAERLWRRPDYYHCSYLEPGPRQEIHNKVLDLGCELFDAFLIEKIVRCDKSYGNKPIVVVAGGAHIWTIESLFKRLKFKQLKRCIELTPDRKQDIPFKPELLDLLEVPLEVLDGSEPEKLWPLTCICQ